MREKLRREILELQRSDYIVDFLIDLIGDHRLLRQRQRERQILVYGCLVVLVLDMTMRRP